MKTEEQLRIINQTASLLQNVPKSLAKETATCDSTEIVGVELSGSYNELGFLKYINLSFILGKPVDKKQYFRIFPHEFQTVENFQELVDRLVTMAVKQYKLELEKLAQCELF